MVRRLVLAGLAAVMAVPIFVTTPASAAVLFTCPGIDDLESSIDFTPGLAHTQTAQTAVGSMGVSATCSNGETGAISFGDPFQSQQPVTSYGARPLGCPVGFGGTGPDYADQTPILLGATAPSFQATWANAGTSTGIAKAKQGTAGDQYRLVLNITSGAYAPPAGKKTKIKVVVDISPYYTGVSYTCADNSDPLEKVSLTTVGDLVVQKK